MRRILRKISNNQQEQIGDVSTLADPSVVEHLIEQGLLFFCSIKVDKQNKAAGCKV